MVQGLLLKHMLKRVPIRVLASVGLAASAITYLGFGLATDFRQRERLATAPA